MSKILMAALCVSLSVSAIAQTAPDKKITQQVESLLQKMTLEEKIGQMNQYNGPWSATGPLTNDGNLLDQVKSGKVGSMLNVTGVKRTRELQALAMQSRLKIPLLFGQDVIHGYRTIFPIPLAEAASWDLGAMETSARVAAIETSASGMHWTFAPMVDIARDPRWGRVMEGAGEDPYLASLIARARVRGFQGRGLGDTSAVMACAKHFAAYGAAVGGRDYNSVDMSMRQLHETYLPPFKAALDAGVSTFMNSFNDLNGIPATGSRYLQRELLKGKWNFTGFVVSDWGSIGEMIQHGYASDNKEAAMIAANAGSDMDMESRSYTKYLATLVKEGKVKISVIDEAVRRILRKKFELGLFADPYKFSNEKREETNWNNPAHLATAREMARKSIVLLKNESQTLPIPASVKSIALIGPFVKAKKDHLGFWSYDWPDDTSRILSIWEAVQQQAPAGTRFHYAPGCTIAGEDRSGFAEALEAAKQSDYVILTTGEARDMSGEAKSRSRIGLPGVQEELIRAILALGKPTVVLISAGRPLVFEYTAAQAPAILYTWWLGTAAGPAIADVLFGSYNPSGRLPMSFPRNEGQIPIYYNHYNTGRPAMHDSDKFYRSAYTDLSIYPRYSFGYGLSYTDFDYSPVSLSSPVLKPGQTLTATVTIRNRGQRAGTETVQLYIRDMVGSVVRPVKELKGFRQVYLQPGESRQVSFNVTTDDLRFYNEQLQYIWEPGAFRLYIGRDAGHENEAGFEVKR